MHFLTEYGLFFIKLATIVIAILVTIGFIAAIAGKGKEEKDRLKIKNLNKKYHDYHQALTHEILNKSEFKQQNKETKKEQKRKSKEKTLRKKIYLLNFHGDIRATATQSLREEITALLTIAKPQDEVIVRIESGGGMVPSYGLAASQLKRLRDNHIPLTVTVDKVAASGGYMMACVANKILAAPFAIIGSIGVVAQLPNFHRFLKKKEIDYEQIMAGEYKRTLSLFGENTEKGREKTQEDIDNVHQLFKEFILTFRPEVNIDQVATGEHWHGEKALQLKLIDDIITSDEYLRLASKDANIFEIHYAPKKSLASKLSLSTQESIKNIIEFFMTKVTHFWV